MSNFGKFRKFFEICFGTIASQSLSMSGERTIAGQSLSMNGEYTSVSQLLNVSKKLIITAQSHSMSKENTIVGQLRRSMSEKCSIAMQVWSNMIHSLYLFFKKSTCHYIINMYHLPLIPSFFESEAEKKYRGIARISTEMSLMKNGFSLIEVMIAVSVASLMLMPVFTLQTRVLMRVTRQTRRLESIFLAEQFKYEVQREIPADIRQFTKEKTVEGIKLIFTRTSIAQGSKIGQFPGMLKDAVEARWQSGRESIKEILVSYIYKPEKEKKE